MPFLKFLFKGGDAVAFGDEKDKEVIDEVGGFVDHSLVIAFDGFDDGLYGLFADLLGHSWGSGLEEGCRVGLLRHLVVTAFDDTFQLADEA